MARNSLLTDRTRQSIIRMLAESDQDGEPKFSHQKIAKRFGVATRTVSRIARQAFYDLVRQEVQNGTSETVD